MQPSDKIKNAVDGLERESNNFYEFIAALNIFFRELYNKDIILTYDLEIHISLESFPDVYIIYTETDNKIYDGTFIYTGSTNV